MSGPYLVFFSLVVLAIATDTALAQPGPTALDDYINNAETIVVAKCLSAGPVDILMRSDVRLDVIHVVKGDASLKTMSLKLRGGLVPGDIYLIRVAEPRKSKEEKGFANEGANVIPIAPYEDLVLLKTLSPRIVVLRTINRRVDELESTIRRSTYELELLRAVRKDN